MFPGFSLLSAGFGLVGGEGLGVVDGCCNFGVRGVRLSSVWVLGPGVSKGESASRMLEYLRYSRKLEFEGSLAQ